MTRTRERVPFRLLRMPCCGHQLCWVNPRLPSYCPECGAKSYRALRFEGEHTLVSDDGAWLNLENPLTGVVLQGGGRDDDAEVQ